VFGRGEELVERVHARRTATDANQLPPSMKLPLQGLRRVLRSPRLDATPLGLSPFPPSDPG
jgi:hypothetical protein